MSLSAQISRHLANMSPDQPVLIAGPTASGKSALALEIAETQGGVIVNADALQVFDNWRVLSARPSTDDESRAPHALYGHVDGTFGYSVGHWLREAVPYLSGPQRPIFVGGTGLYFSAITEGLVEIPPTPDDIRATGNARRADEGDHLGLLADLDAEDPETAQKIDRLNPMRVQRAWEVLRATGCGLAAWQAMTPPPALALNSAYPIVMDADKDWLNARIARRFQMMLDEGALEEVEANLATWDPKLPSSKAIGAPELIAYLQGKMTLHAAQEAATIATRQFAKRQRTWFRARMKQYHKISLP
ncbi:MULTISPECIES: tRNA (adenosine(37)-N6)-dimethylallyltransferase MiaA [Pacificibacter]|uniref:tRNA (adenosine(37)-N6)-dimethylallyltransferase MiaA n=1 Tax=Pacificibacter TaxID=1042323 RepID=UPI001C0A0912|nr:MULTISPECIES: tRNA (adenosine(37)-N6)-dimethylallyltransferase MiaA [Pacificibacter]MBU2936865.1 tRNA (adenosine(37)-N6)-dimethylallyltransferase MiaA [Pacificibacter marinus]MDO6614859.1 tRNA (adenosine(37)-N6)-dimethylallyltransferase MiaA [Pacificibacter sp. 1_MG-2023]